MERCSKGGMQERRDARKGGGGSEAKEKCRKVGIHEMRDANLVLKWCE